jgi:hypothetical protein
MAAAGCDAETALRRLLEKRAKVIAGEQYDPLRCGWEPSIWLVVRALLDWPWCHKGWEDEIQRRLGMTWEEFKGAMLRKLTFPEPVKMVLLLGGNRSGKSELEAKMGQEMLSHKPKSAVVACHMSDPRSVMEQQPLYWKYMRPEWRIKVQSATTYIKYQLKTGFADSSFITPILSIGRFINYSQNMDTALQGIEPDFVNADELAPPDWIENFVFRLATRSGKALVGFTPVHGYTPTVQIFLEGALTVMEQPAYLCPKDGKERLEHAALRLTLEEYQEIWDAHKAKPPRPPMAPQSRPEDVLEWLEERIDGPPSPKGYGAANDLHGRSFEMMPRVMRCVDPRKAVVFFWSNDNPYGNPKEVVADLRAKTVSGLEGVRERYYGFPDRVAHGKFPKFRKRAHVLPTKTIPERGLDYLFVDPANGRNFCMTWIRVNAGRAYVRREWPGRYWIPEVGVPGPWTIPSGKKEGLNDGARGEGQGPWGFGTLRMKFEIARLEGWACWRKWHEGMGTKTGGGITRENQDAREWIPREEEIDEWEEGPEDAESLEGRYIDSRAASNPRMERDRPRTLQTDFERIGLYFDLTPGNEVGDGIQRINAMLDYTADPGDEHGTNFLNAPRLYISEECPNTIYAMENWKYCDGDKGACKDPVDNIRYFADLGLIDEEASGQRERGGMAYGHARGMGQGAWGRKGRRLPPATIGGKACRI